MYLFLLKIIFKKDSTLLIWVRYSKIKNTVCQKTIFRKINTKGALISFICLVKL